MTIIKKTLLATAIAPFFFQAGVASADNLQDRVAELEKQLLELKSLMAAEKAEQQEKGVEIKKGTRFQYGGYIKFDATSTDTTEVGHYFNPNSIKIDGVATEEREYASSAKQSRFWLKATKETDKGDLAAYIEMDFTGGDDQEKLTNNNASRMRHAFLKWSYEPGSSLLAGQTWTTFMNTGAYPDTLDWVGPTAGIIFIRQQQIRWTKALGNGSSFMLSAENPYSFVIGDGEDTADRPDLVARYNGKLNNFNYSLALMNREVDITTGVGPTIEDDTQSLFAYSLSGKYDFGNGDDLKFMYTSGSPGRYLALGAWQDAYVDASGDLEALDVDGWYLAYKHKWNSQWRSNIIYAQSEADNPQSPTSTESVSNANLNLIYSPVPKLSLGAEYITGKKELENGDDGDATRMQFTAKYVY